MMNSTMSHLGKQYIGGQWQAAGARDLISLRADDGQPTGYQFYSATAKEVELASLAAHHAFMTYSQTDLSLRAQFLENIADEIAALKQDFLEIVATETALSIVRLTGEQARTCGQLRLFAQLLRRGDIYAARIDTAMTQRQPPRVDLRQYHTALGPVAVFGASNFPLAFSTAGGDTAAALAAGCPVIFKAHLGHMATTEMVTQAIERAIIRSEMPDGVFNLLYGGNVVGAQLVQQPEIQAVGFTGSQAGGKALVDLARQRPSPIPVFAEMSSINPIIILPSALQQRSEEIAQGLVASFTLGAGQFCTKPGLIIGIGSEEWTRFVEQLIANTAQQAAQVMLNPSTLQQYLLGIAAFKQHPDMVCLAEGETARNVAQAALYQAEVDLLLNKDPLLQQELFGPVSVVVTVKDQQQLYQVVNQLAGQLTISLFVEEKVDEQRLPLTQLLTRKAGRVLINGYPTGVEVCDAMVHGGPYPATTDARGTSVGTLAIWRFLRPICLQNYPQAWLPPILQDANPLQIPRLVNGVLTKEIIEQSQTG